MLVKEAPFKREGVVIQWSQGYLPTLKNQRANGSSDVINTLADIYAIARSSRQRAVASRGRRRHGKRPRLVIAAECRLIGAGMARVRQL